MRCHAGLWGALLAILLAGQAQAAVMPGYSGIVLGDSPLGYWRFDEPAGAVQATDSSGNNRSLNLTGFDAGQFGQPGATADRNAALYFRDPKGASLREDTAESPNTTDFSFASGESFSIEYWVKVAPGHASSADTGVLGDNYDQSENRPWYMSRLTGSGDTRRADFFLRTAGGSSKQALGATNLVDDRWHHVVGIYDASAATTNLYVDSVLEATATAVTPDAYGTNGDTFILGNHNNRTLDARLDEVAVYATALDANQVLSHYQSAQNKLLVDFGNSIGSGGGPGGRQNGFFDFEAAEGGANPAVMKTFESGLGADGTVDVTIAGYTHFRDYAAIASGPFAAQTRLLSDMVLRNANGTMTLTLEDLADGAYLITTYHHNTGQATPGTILSTLLTDGLVTNKTISQDLVLSTGTAPTSVVTQEFLFHVLGGSPVSISFSGGAASQHIQLNGFELLAVPEPSSLALIVAAALGAAVLLRKRRMGRS